MKIKAGLLTEIRTADVSGLDWQVCIDNDGNINCYSEINPNDGRCVRVLFDCRTYNHKLLKAYLSSKHTFKLLVGKILEENNIV